MLRIGASFVLALGIAAAGPASAQIKTLWNCKDQRGRTTLTDQKADTVGKDCRIVSEERVSVVPATKAKSPSITARLKPAVFSKGEPVETRRRDIWTTPGQTSRDFIKATQCRVLILKSSGVRRQFPELSREPPACFAPPPFRSARSSRKRCQQICM